MEYKFDGNLVTLNLMTCIGPQTSTHPLLSTLHTQQLQSEQASGDGRAIELSHIPFEQLGERLNTKPLLDCLRGLYETYKSAFGLRLKPRHTVIMKNFLRSFRKEMGVFETPYTDAARPLNNFPHKNQILTNQLWKPKICAPMSCVKVLHWWQAFSTYLQRPL